MSPYVLHERDGWLQKVAVGIDRWTVNGNALIFVAHGDFREYHAWIKKHILGWTKHLLHKCIVKGYPFNEIETSPVLPQCKELLLREVH